MTLKLLTTNHSRYLLLQANGEVRKSYEIQDYLKKHSSLIGITCICLTLYLIGFMYLPTLLVPPLVVFSYVFGGKR